MKLTAYLFLVPQFFALVFAQTPKKGKGWASYLPMSRSEMSFISSSNNSDTCRQVNIRTLSGRCTSLIDPSVGQARLAQFSYFNTDSREPNGEDLKSPRAISNIVSKQSKNTINSMGLNEMFTFFGQFIDHDSALSPEDEEDPLPITVPAGDSSLYSPTLSFFRSTRSRVSNSTEIERPITVLSSALDLSQVYASDEERNAALRLPESCRLNTSAGNMLPFNTEGFANSPSVSSKFFIAGDTRVSETPVLTTIHTVFLREHNRLCERLESRFRSFSPQQLYETARAINIAQFQKIVYEEWLPAILGSRLPRYRGYQESVNPTISVEFTTAGFRLGHTLVGNGVSRIDSRGNRLPSLTMEEMFFLISNFRPADVDTVLRGASGTAAQEVDEKVVDALRNFLFENVRDAEGFDLVALNLQRGRDHALPKFNELRKLFLGEPARSFDEISSNPETAAALEEAYGDVNKVEAWVGLVAEDKDEGVGVGRTLAQFMKTEFARLRDGDRFFYMLKNQIPKEVLTSLRGVGRGLFSRRFLFNRILIRNTSIRRRLIPANRNAFVLRRRRRRGWLFI